MCGYSKLVKHSIIKNCGLASQWCDYFGDLDYSERSIYFVEQYLDMLYAAIHATDENNTVAGIDIMSEERIISKAIVLGTYVGEVIIKKFGPQCSWGVSDLKDSKNVLNVFHLKIEDEKFFPVETVYRRLKEGEKFDITHFYLETVYGKMYSKDYFNTL